ncbi:MAG: NAD(P)H-dependent oxidoreductase [Lachnospiraceae bacterium]|nr:NAD(P)H-dependent oxidoreductase [Lachnospiraceae bacterium]
MKTLIFNGSPRPDGDTVSLIRILTGDADRTKKSPICADTGNETVDLSHESGQVGRACEKPSEELKCMQRPTVLIGEYLLVNAYRADISACVDCRWCWSHEGCKINDGMQGIYEYMKECDNILIASPIHFSELTGKLLALLSRLQSVYCARAFQNTELIAKPKRGAILLVGGGDGRPDRACTTARILLHTMNCAEIMEPVISHQTNERPAAEDEEAVQGVRKIAEFFNR